MDFKKMGFGLGVFSIALGVAELFGSKSIARGLEAEGSERLIKGFGARELFAGVSLLASPAVSTNVWGRVAGDVMDVGALALAARSHPGNKLVRGAIAFVLAALALDVFVARGLDKQTGKMAPDAAGRNTDMTDAGANARSPVLAMA